MAVLTPPPGPPRRIQQALADAGMTSVVGGSGLLASLGLTDVVNDWDIVVDGDPARVERVLDSMGYLTRCVGPGGVFRTAALFEVTVGGHTVDVLVDFALAGPDGVVAIPARPGSTWRGLLMARPEEWEIAYTLMGRPERASLLAERRPTSPRSAGRGEAEANLRQSGVVSLLVDVVNVFVDDNGDFGNPLGIVWASPATRKHEQEIATDLGFSETVFIDAVHDRTARARIFTPAQELPFAGHPMVGLAAWLHRNGDEVTDITVPAGSVRVRVEDDRFYITAMPEWAPAFEIDQLDSPEAVEAVDPDAYGLGVHYVWAWLDESQREVRSRMFAPDLGVREDEATGSAAVRLAAELGRDLEIVQGRGSRIFTHLRYLGRQVEVGGRVSEERTVELR